MGLVLRGSKGSQLNYAELDGNFTYLLSEIVRVEGLTSSANAVQFTAQTLTTAEQNQARANIGAVDTKLSSLPYDLTATEREQIRQKLGIEEVAPPVRGAKVLFTHIISETDIENSDLKLDLPSTPDVRDIYDLHINTGWVKPTSYELVGNQLVVYADRLPYSLKVGAELIFQYISSDV